MASGEEAVLLSDHNVSGAYRRIPADIAALTHDVTSLVVC